MRGSALRSDPRYQTREGEATCRLHPYPALFLGHHGVVKSVVPQPIMALNTRVVQRGVFVAAELEVWQLRQQALPLACELWGGVAQAHLLRRR